MDYYFSMQNDTSSLDSLPLSFNIHYFVNTGTHVFQFVIQWKEKFAVSAWCENARTREKKKLWRRKDRKPTDAFQYPWKEVNQENRS